MLLAKTVQKDYKVQGKSYIDSVSLLLLLLFDLSIK